MMTYQQTIDYLFAQLPMYSRIGAAAYKADLNNTISLCNALNNPQNNFKSIHIAGTNGKGSTSHMLAAILQQAGYKTGLYTSPHLKDFRERIKINGQMISQQFVIDFVQKTKTISDKIKPSFFELTVAMAFDYFSTEKVDIAIIETGLGGRLDSTNIITPILSIITNIGLDHVQILGNTLEKIAYEKAGIIKPNIPIVIGKYLPETKDVFINKATNPHAPIHFVQDEYSVTNITISPSTLQCTITNNQHQHSEDFILDLNGMYQIHNLCTVLCAEGILLQLGFNINNKAEKQALANVKTLNGLNGRWQVIQQNPLLVLDVAHNEDGIKQVLLQLHTFYPNNNYHFVLGMVNDKDVESVLQLLPANANYYFTNAHIPRALPATQLQAIAATYQLNGHYFKDVNEAIDVAKKNASTTDIVIVCGSVFLVAEVNI
jgi:dihydrofolate synthase/folylpolyglutamate synthase